MKKFYPLLGLLALAGVLPALAGGTSYSKVNAASTLYGDNVFPNGDFSISTGEYAIPETAPTEGVIAGYAKWAWDVVPIAMIDPDDSTNTVLSFPQGSGFASMFKLLTIESGATYDIYFDYKVSGSTDNIGIAFWCNTTGDRLPELNIMDATQFEEAGATSTDLGNGFTRVSWTRTFTEGNSYDSAHLWGNVASGTTYLDNFTMIKQGDTENIFTGGDFEGFLDYALPEITDTPNDYGLYGSNATLASGSVTLGAESSYYGGVVDYSNNVHELSVTIDGEVPASSSLVATATDDEGTTIEEVEIIADGTFLGTDNVFTGEFAASSSITRLLFDYAGSAAISLTNVSLRAEYESPYDPSYDYYEGENLTVNGDFEAFDVGTVFSETQLEGAWGSVSLDNPARIVLDENGSKVARIGKLDATDTKSYSSMFLMTPDTLSVGDIMRLRYDYKLVMSQDHLNYTEINSCLVGGSNTSYYLIDLRKLAIDESYTSTSGAETTPYPLKYEVLDNGYIRVTMDWVITTDMVQWNSVRWLYPALAEGDTLSIDNVEMHVLYEEEPVVDVTSVTITDGDIELAVGDTKTLTATVAPSDAADKSLTWASSNTAVATVDSTGKVTAVATGTAEITATASNGVKGSIVVTVTSSSDPTPTPSDSGGSTNVGLIVGLVIGGVALVAIIVCLVIYLRKRKVNKQ